MSKPLPLTQRLNQSLWASLVALGCIVAVGLLQVPQLHRLSNRASTASPEDLQQDVEAEKLRIEVLQNIPSFGFDNLLADWAFLNFLQYFGDEPVRAVTGYGLSPEYFEVVVEQDPHFLDAYLYLSTSGSLYAAKPERSIALMEKGLESLSPEAPRQSYIVWRQKAIDELLFLGDAEAARQSFEKAAEWASTHPDQESQTIADISRRTAEFLADNPDSKSAQISAWTMVLSNVSDQRSRQIAINQVEELGGEVITTPEGTVKIRLPQTD
jgi:tetratricopeptide (TPR) repeat protein